MALKQSTLTQLQSQLSDFVEAFSECFGRSERKHWCKMYLSGLLLDGERKSIQPMAARLDGGNEQALQQFVKDSPWDSRAVQQQLYRLVSQRLIGCSRTRDLILDDTGLPKKGKASVGVARQYCGATGKIDNCQSVVSWHCSSDDVHFPMVAQLYLPENWTVDPQRMDKSHVPDSARVFKEKWRLALSLLDEIADETVDTLLFDAGYGSNRMFLRELDRRQHTFIGQVRGSEHFWPGDMELDHSATHPSGQGRRRSYPQAADRTIKTRSVQQWAEVLFAEKKNIKHCTLPLKTPQRVEYVTLRVYETMTRPYRHIGTARWLIIERLACGQYNYYVSNCPESQSPRSMLIKAHQRWKVEQGYQQLKEELGLDHYEGRSWNGLHHHITLCFMAYGFLQIVRKRKKNISPYRRFLRCVA